MLPTPSLSHCAALIRAYDHDRYICTLFAPATVREAWFSLFAFNHEIAAIPETVSEEMLGFVRFAWWREALDEIYGGGVVRRHPVVQALSEIVAAYKLPRGLFDALITGRQERFAGEPFTELPQWEAYFQATSSSLFKLCALMAGVTGTDALDDLGIAWGAIGTARMALLQSDKASAESLMEAGERWLAKTHGRLPQVFIAFENALVFYLKRLKAGKPVGREISSLLTLNLCWRRLLYRFRIPGAAARQKY